MKVRAFTVIFAVTEQESEEKGKVIIKRADCKYLCNSQQGTKKNLLEIPDPLHGFFCLLFLSKFFVSFGKLPSWCVFRSFSHALWGIYLKTSTMYIYALVCLSFLWRIWTLSFYGYRSLCNLQQRGRVRELPCCLCIGIKNVLILEFFLLQNKSLVLLNLHQNIFHTNSCILTHIAFFYDYIEILLIVTNNEFRETIFIEVFRRKSGKM